MERYEEGELIIMKLAELSVFEIYSEAGSSSFVRIVNDFTIRMVRCVALSSTVFFSREVIRPILINDNSPNTFYKYAIEYNEQYFHETDFRDKYDHS